MEKKKIIIISVAIGIIVILIGIFGYKKVKENELFNTLLPRINQTNEYIDSGEVDKASKSLEDLKQNSKDNSKVIKQIDLIQKRLNTEKKKQEELAKKQEGDQLEQINKANELLNESKLEDAEKIVNELSNKNMADKVKNKFEEVRKLLIEKNFQNKIKEIDALVKNNKLNEAENKIKEIDRDKISTDNLNKLEEIKSNIKKKKEANSVKNMSRNLGQLRKTILGYNLVAPSDNERTKMRNELKATGKFPAEYIGDVYFSAIGNAGFEAANSTMVKPNILYKGKPAYKVTLYLACAYIEGGTGYLQLVVDVDGVQRFGNELRNAINANQVLDINTKRPVEFNPGKIYERF